MLLPRPPAAVRGPEKVRKLRGKCRAKGNGRRGSGYRFLHGIPAGLGTDSAHSGASGGDLQLRGRRPIGVAYAVRCALLGVLFLLLVLPADSFAQLPVDVGDAVSVVPEAPSLTSEPTATEP